MKVQANQIHRIPQHILANQMQQWCFHFPFDMHFQQHRLDRAVEAGKLTQEDADKKLESILSGEVNR